MNMNAFWHPKEIWMPSQYLLLRAHYGREGRCIWKWYAMHSKHLGKISSQISGCCWSVCLGFPPHPPLSDLKTALVERDDFSSGTSSRSTKLIHGGVRYLQKAIMKLDYEQVNASFFLHGWHLSVEFLVVWSYCSISPLCSFFIQASSWHAHIDWVVVISFLFFFSSSSRSLSPSLW